MKKILWIFSKAYKKFNTDRCPLLASALVPGFSRAQVLNDFPSPALLEELRARLTEPAPCHPQCAELASAGVRLDGAALSVSLSIAAQDAVAVALPMVSEGWRPETVRIDGTDGGLIHYIEGMDPEDVAIGMPVEAVFKPKNQRKGSILDIKHFRPR